MKPTFLQIGDRIINPNLIAHAEFNPLDAGPDDICVIQLTGVSEPLQFHREEALYVWSLLQRVSLNLTPTEEPANNTED